MAQQHSDKPHQQASQEIRMKISNPFTRSDGSKVWTGDSGRRVQMVTVPRAAVRQQRIHQAAVRAEKAGRSAS